jgi:hypothetical protein
MLLHDSFFNLNSNITNPSFPRSMQASYAKKLSCSVEQQKNDPAQHGTAKSIFLFLSISITSDSRSIICRILHTLSFNM